MSEVREASAVYDAAMASLLGCKGLFTAPLTERKRELLRERLRKGGAFLATAFLMIDEADAEPPFIPMAPPKPPEAGNVVAISERRSRKRGQS
jgi:hypothetical protein